MKQFALQQGETFARVGDGINDSNVPAQTDISVAMDKGSDIATDVAKNDHYFV